MTERAAKVLSETVTPSGLVAVCRLPATGLDEVLAGQPGLSWSPSISPNPATPHPHQALRRDGAAAVVFAGHSVDPYNGKCLRSSAGSIFALPVIVEPDTAVVAARLRSSGLQVLATTLDGELSLDDTGTLLSASTAWLFGGEAHGLSTEVAALADHRVRIPMSGGAEPECGCGSGDLPLPGARARRGAGPPGRTNSGSARLRATLSGCVDADAAIVTQSRALACHPTPLRRRNGPGESAARRVRTSCEPGTPRATRPPVAGHVVHRQSATVPGRRHERRGLDQGCIRWDPSGGAPVGRQRPRIQADLVGNRPERHLHRLAEQSQQHLVARRPAHPGLLPHHGVEQPGRNPALARHHRFLNS